MKLFFLFIFIFILMFGNTSFGGELNCSIYRNGYFVYAGEYDQFIIFREGDYQIEYNFKTKEWVTVKLSWTDGCDYSFLYVATNIKSLKNQIGNRMTVDIISGTSTGYFYRAVDERSGKEFEGHIVFLKEKLTPSQEKRIVSKMEKTSNKK